MSEEIKAAEGKEESFEELLNQSFKTLNNGDRVTGIVTAITPPKCRWTWAPSRRPTSSSAS